MIKCIRAIALSAVAVLLATCSARANPITFTSVISFDAPGASKTWGAGINDNGDVAGYYTTSTGATQGYVRHADGTFNNPIVHPSDNGNFTRALGINDSGIVVGDFATVSGPTTTFHGYSLSGGSYSGPFDVGGPVSTSIFGINSKGDFVGTYGSNVQPNQGFLDVGGTLTKYSVPGATTAFGLGINSLDQVVGQFTDATGAIHGYFRNADGTVTQIDVPGALATAATGINDSGDIVGIFIDSLGKRHGFIDDPGNFQIFDVLGADGTSILGIDSAGDITGYYTDANRGQHAFEAIASPEPSSLILLAVAGLTVGGRNLLSRGRRRGSEGV